MNSDQFYDAITAIALTSSKTEKIELIRQYGQAPGFLRYLRAALDDRVTYGIAKVPPFDPVGAGNFGDETWALLERLAKRELTGRAARRALLEELEGLSAESAEVLTWILKKDLRAGFTANSVNRAFPGAIPTFECMLAHPFEVRRIGRWPVFLEPKVDGFRTLAFVDITPTPTVTFYSRNGNEFTSFEHLKQPLIDAFLADGACGNFVVDAEVVSGSFNKTSSELRRKEEQATDAILVVFDVLTRAEFELPDARGYCPAPPYAARRERLEIFPIGISDDLINPAGRGPVLAAPHVTACSVEEIHHWFERWLEAGLEGAMVKLRDHLYRKDRDYGWMKLKAEESEDLPIVGAEPGKPGTKYAHTLGAVVVDRKGVKVNVSGMSDALRDEMWKAYLRDRAREEAGDAARELLTRLAEIEFHEVTPDGSLRHPRFKRFRDDKRAAE